MYKKKRSKTEYLYIVLLCSVANLYTCVDSWPDAKTLPPQLGEVGGIALNKANDELVVFHRGSRKWENK